MDSLIAAAVAVLGATSTALATAVQQRAARAAPDTGGFSLRLLQSLLRDPRWLAATLGLAFGYSCYLFALARAPLTLIQPILISGLIMGSLFAAWLAGGRPDRRVLAASLLCGAGLLTLLTLARPSAGDYLTGADGSWPRVGGVLGLTLVAGWLVGRRWPASGLALAAGGLFGTTAALTKLVLAQFADGWSAPLGRWQLYAMLATAVLGFLMSQRSFQLSALLAPVNAVICVTDPVVAAMIGIVVFGERVATDPWALAGQGPALIAIAVGVSWVNRRSTELARRRNAQDPEDEVVLRWG